MKRALLTALLAAIGLVLSGVATADLSGYAIHKLAFEGDPDPTLGTLSQMVGEVDMDANGRVTFVCWVDDGSDVAIKIFQVDDGVLSTLVGEGDAVPGASGLVFKDLGRARNAAPDVLAYLGLYDDALGDSQSGGFLRVGAADFAFALRGTPAPGGGSIEDVVYVHGATSAPGIAFGAFIDDGGPGLINAHLVHESTGLREIYRDGDAAPAPIGGTFSGVQAWWIPALTADGTATFYSDIAGGSATSGFFRSSPTGVVTPVLLAGDAVTTPGGGSFESFFKKVGANADGDLVIAPFVLRPPLTFAPQALFVLEGGVQREIVFWGDPIPGTSPPRIYGQLAGSGPPALDLSGTVTFVGILTDELQNVSERALLVDAGNGIEVIAKEGDPVPGVPGATFTDFLQVRITDTGTIAFFGYTSAGSGVFLATPPPEAVPAVPPIGLLLLAVGVAAAGAARRLRS